MTVDNRALALRAMLFPPLRLPRMMEQTQPTRT